MTKTVDFTKTERKGLRLLAAAVYEAEARQVLGELDQAFIQWRCSEIESSELLDKIHTFNQHQSRELWGRYQALREPEIVARGIALGLISAAELPADIAGKLQALTEFFVRAIEE